MKARLTYDFIRALKPKNKDYEVRDTKQPGLVLRVRKSGAMSYAWRYGRSKRLTIGSADKIELVHARAKATEIVDQKLFNTITSKKTYVQFLDENYAPYLETHLRNGIDNEKNVTNTIACLKNRFEEFHGLKLHEITVVLIDDWKQRRKKEGKTPATINRQLNDLRAYIRFAVDREALSSSPFDTKKIKPFKIDPNPKTRFLSPKEELSLRKVLDEREAKKKAERQSANRWRSKRSYPLKQEYYDYLKPAILLSLNTGLRLSELFGLKYSDVDFEQRVLTVVGSIAKSGKSRYVPLTDEALKILKQLQRQPGIKSLWVLHDKDGQPIQNPRVAFVEVLRKAKISGFRWHDLRHTFASKLVMAGVDLNTVREFLGHADIKMTLRYSHLSASHKAEAIKKLQPAISK